MDRGEADQRAEPGIGWTPAELNHILHAHVVDSALTTFGFVEWESQLFRGTMHAICYPFNMPKNILHAFNQKVRTFINLMNIPGTYWYIQVHTSMYVVCTDTYHY